MLQKHFSSANVAVGGQLFYNVWPIEETKLRKIHSFKHIIVNPAMLLQSLPACVYLGLGKCKILLLFYVLRTRTPGILRSTEKQTIHPRRCPQTKTSNLPRKAPNVLKQPPSKWLCLTLLCLKEKLRYVKKRPIKSILFNSLLPLSLFSSVGGSVYFIVLWRIHKAAKQNQCESTMLRGTRREMQRYTPLSRTKNVQNPHALCCQSSKKRTSSCFPQKAKYRTCQRKEKSRRKRTLFFLNSGEIGQAFFEKQLSQWKMIGV